MAEAKSPVHDLLGGTVGGICQVLVGHPFNTVKVRLQTAAPGVFSGAMDCLKQTVRKEGFLGLYKGMSSPLVGIGAINATMFFASGVGQSIVANFKYNGDKSKITLPEYALCGCFAGAVQTIVACPVELVMVRLQTQHTLSPNKVLYHGPIDCVKKLTAERGIAGLLQGFTATLFRDMMQFTGYIFAYESVKASFRAASGEENPKITTIQTLLAGGTAGVVAQLSQLPMDVVKSRMQTQDPLKKTYQTTLSCIRATFAEYGVGGFFKGLGPVLLRAFPANAVTFLGFEMTLELLSGK